MPKIVFRPNPTPPPFVPPTPEPIQNSVHINPYPFNAGDNIQVTLYNLQQISNFLYVNFGWYNKNTDEMQLSPPIAQDGEPIPTNFNLTISDASEQIGYFFLSIETSTYVSDFLILNLV